MRKKIDEDKFSPNDVGLLFPIGSHGWCIYLHLGDFYGKCWQIYHTWILWVREVIVLFMEEIRLTI